MDIKKNAFGKIGERTISLYSLQNDKGMVVECIDYGCTITSILTPDRHGNYENVVLGFDELDDYLNHSPYFGATVGRVAGRIRSGRYSINNKTYSVSKNEGDNHLHGGYQGFSYVIWNAKTLLHHDSATIEFTYHSPDGEEGYPGNLSIKVSYTLTNLNELIISYEGMSDKATLLNVTNHSYFNLSGNLKTDITGHELTLKSDSFLELDEQALPTGNVLDVIDTPFDFREGRKLGKGIHDNHSQLVLSKGYDHPFILNSSKEESILLKDCNSGRQLIIETDEPCVVVYTSNKLAGEFFIRGAKAENHLAVCLETQGFPDAVHHKNFPSIVLEKDQTYFSKTKYSFGLLDES